MANKKNFANGVLASAVADTDTDFDLASGQGSRMPATPFYLTITPANQLSTEDNSEIVLVTAVSTDNLTVTRAQRGTTAKSFASGDIVGNAIYKEDLDEKEDVSNKSTNTSLGTSDTLYPTQKAVKTYVDNFAPENGFVLGEIPSGTVDGSNVTFTTANAYIEDTLVVYVEGIRQIRDVHYTESIPGSGQFTFTTAPSVGYAISVDYMRNLNTGTVDADTVDGYHASTFLSQLATGLIPANETWTYSSWNSTTRIGVITVPTDATTKYSAGMRIKMTLATNGTMWGIVQSVTSTTLTVFFQSGKTFANQTITNNSYSMVKNPLGFPADPNNWKLEFTSTTDYSTAATNGTWYKLNAALQLTIPAGSWNVYYQVCPYVQAGANTTNTKAHSALSTSTSSPSDEELWCGLYIYTATSDVKRTSAGNFQRSKVITLASDTTYHLIVSMSSTNGTIDIRANNDPNTVIRAVNAYL